MGAGHLRCPLWVSVIDGYPMTVLEEIDGKGVSHMAEADHAYMSGDKYAGRRPVAERILQHVISSLSSVTGCAGHPRERQH